MLVRGTDEVVIDVDDGADANLIGPLLYGAAVRALLLHGGVFTVHATVIRHDSAVIGLAGSSGAGNSTTTLTLRSEVGDMEPGPGAPVLVTSEVSGAERLRWIVRLSNATGLASLGGRGPAYFGWATPLSRPDRRRA